MRQCNENGIRVERKRHYLQKTKIYLKKVGAVRGIGNISPKTQDYEDEFEYEDDFEDDFEEEEYAFYRQNGENKVVNTEDLLKNVTYTYHFTGKFKALVSGAGRGFLAMLYGKPGSGKSTFALQFANYLSKWGRVLYVSNEETRNRLGNIEATNSLKINLERQNINPKNKNIRWANDFRGIDLAEYEFVFMDSFQTLQMTEQELEQLKHQYVDTAFIYVFQSTKEGQFRGNQTLAHNVDALIHVTEKHTAYNHKRYAGEAYSPETAINVFE